MLESDDFREDIRKEISSEKLDFKSSVSEEEYEKLTTKDRKDWYLKKFHEIIGKGRLFNEYFGEKEHYFELLKQINEEINSILPSEGILKTKDESIVEMYCDKLNQIVTKMESNDLLDDSSELKQEIDSLLPKQEPLKINEHIVNNLNKLSEWTGKRFSKVLFEGSSYDYFRKNVFGHKQLYFIIVDNSDNVFGFYFSALINEFDKYIYDRDSFMFTLNSPVDGKTPVKYESKDFSSVYLSSPHGTNGFFKFNAIDIDMSKERPTHPEYVNNFRMFSRFKDFNVNKFYKNANLYDGNYYYFIVKQLVVIEMKSE